MLLKARSLSKKFGDRVLFRDLSFNLEVGNIYQVKGLNGSGKSTLLKILAGLLLPTTGEIQKKPFLKTGYSSLDFNLYPDLTVGQTLEWCAEIKHTSAPHSSLPADQYVGTLSSGQISYLKLLISTLNSPELLILDEVHCTLDPINKKAFFNIVQSQQVHSAIVFTSHQPITELQIYQEIVIG